jgi:hypothetical protein
MTAPDLAPPAPPARLLWLNGPYSIGKRTLAAHLRDDWGLVVFDGEDLGTLLQRGLPPQRDPGDLHDLPAWHRSLVKLGSDLAHIWPPLLVMPATLYHPATADQLLEGFRARAVDVVHVVLTAEEAALRARINDRPVDRDAKRWALRHLRPALVGLADMRQTVRLDTTDRTLGQVAGELADVLRDHNWLTREGQWTTAGP